MSGIAGGPVVGTLSSSGSQGGAGPQGATGPQGTQGNQGAQGAQGFQGASGATSVSNTDGFSTVTPTTGAVVVSRPAATVVTVTSNAGTVPVTASRATFTNTSAATMAIILATSGAISEQPLIVAIYDFSAAAETIGWTNTENSTQSVPTTSNGSTTLPLTVGFLFNSATSKWRCVSVV